MAQRAGQGRAGATRPEVLPTAIAWPRRKTSFALSSPRDILSTWLAAEVEGRRLFLWIPVAYGLGICLAFAADGPLSLVPPLLGGFAFAAAAFIVRRRPVAAAAAIGTAAMFFGFAAAVFGIGAADAPILERTLVKRFSGFVESSEERITGGRLVVRLTALDGIPPTGRPLRIRVSARSLAGAAPGDHISGTARLLRPPEAARPGGFDFARDAFFRGIGAVGSVSGRITRTEPSEPPGFRLLLAARIDQARNVFTARIAGAIGGQAGAVAAALVTGKRGLISDDTNDALRGAGIYHVVSISGLHMMLAAGVFFWLARALLALAPTLALGWPCKKIAAVVGMAGATAYCVFSGSDVAAERSLCMILVMQGAILVDRPALSMRNLAISALIVLTREPETLLGPSFQMSYAAVAGLIALAEWHRRRGVGADRPTDILGRVGGWIMAVVVGTVATTVAATIATGPFAAYHFQALQPYGILGNAVTLPLVSFVVMPGAVLGTLAYPLGLDRPVWWAMGLGVSAVLSLSERVAGLGGAVLVVPAFGVGALALFVAAILLATLCGSTLRRAAILPAAVGLIAAAAAPRPDIYVARDGTGAAVRAPDGRLAILGRVSAFTAEQWLRADGDGRKASAAAVGRGGGCDAIGCTMTLPNGMLVSVLSDRRGFAEDCRRAGVVVTRFAAPPDCAARAIDGPFLARHGATALRAMPYGLHVVTARTPYDAQPWLNRSPSVRPSSAPNSAPDGEARSLVLPRIPPPEPRPSRPPAGQTEPEPDSAAPDGSDDP